MFRGILGAVAGYLVIFALMFALLTGAYLALGTDRAFRPGVYEPSTLWIVVMGVIGFLAAFAGGRVATVLGGARGVKWLIGLVILLAALTIAFEASRKDEATEARPSDVSSVEAMTKARQPLWVSLLNPVIGVVGATLGGRRGDKKR